MLSGWLVDCFGVVLVWCGLVFLFVWVFLNCVLTGEIKFRFLLVKLSDACLALSAVWLGCYGKSR